MVPSIPIVANRLNRCYNKNVKNSADRIIQWWVTDLESFALAYIPSNDKNTKDNESKDLFSVKVNINLWTQCGWDEETPVLDIGLMLSHLSDAQKIKLYLPFPVKKEELKDLCACLSKDANLLGAVFNEPYTSTDITTTKRAVVTKGISGATEFILYKLDCSSIDDVELSDYKNGRGTFLDFNPQVIKSSSKDNSCDKYYLRFRIQSKALKDCVREYQAPNRYFETLVNSTYMIDMRFNNTRSMDLSLVQQLTQNDCHLAPIEGLHFLLMSKVDVDVDANGSFTSSRVLEKDIWNKYVNLSDKEKRKTEDIIAYHHSSKKFKRDATGESEKGDIGSWEFFARLKAGKCGPMTIIPYVLLLILLNVISNLSFNILLTLLPQETPTGPDVGVQLKALAGLVVSFGTALILLNGKKLVAKLKTIIDILFVE